MSGWVLKRGGGEMRGGWDEGWRDGGWRDERWMGCWRGKGE